MQEDYQLSFERICKEALQTIQKTKSFTYYHEGTFLPKLNFKETGYKFNWYTDFEDKEKLELIQLDLEKLHRVEANLRLAYSSIPIGKDSTVDSNQRFKDTFKKIQIQLVQHKIKLQQIHKRVFESQLERLKSLNEKEGIDAHANVNFLISKCDDKSSYCSDNSLINYQSLKDVNVSGLEKGLKKFHKGANKRKTLSELLEGDLKESIKVKSSTLPLKKLSQIKPIDLAESSFKETKLNSKHTVIELSDDEDFKATVASTLSKSSKYTKNPLNRYIPSPILKPSIYNRTNDDDKRFSPYVSPVRPSNPFRTVKSLLDEAEGKKKPINDKRSKDEEEGYTPFVSPEKKSGSNSDELENNKRKASSKPVAKKKKKSPKTPSSPKIFSDAEDDVDERLKNIEPRMVKMIQNEIMSPNQMLTWDDIAGLEHAKALIQEIVVWPMLRPDIFNGVLAPAKGFLLFGPPGTGKTMIGKCIASQSQATFFSISASSLTSKWVGEGEKMVRALFAVARCNQPAVIFVDEIDSLLCQRSEGDAEASRRIKTEFLVQFDGASTDQDERILVVGATNRPQEIDEAARRRFRKRVYIPLPELQGRIQILHNLLGAKIAHFTKDEVEEIGKLTEGYSGSDMDGLCREAALGPIRSIKDIKTALVGDVRSITLNDFKMALKQVRASVDPKELQFYLNWDSQFGSLSAAGET